MSFRTCAIVAVAAIGWTALDANAAVSRTTFDSGTEGWSVSGRDDISPTGGNPGANMDVFLDEVFGAEIRNETNADFLGDLRRFGSSISLSVDTNVHSIASIPAGNQLIRDLVVELIDFNPPGSNYPYVSVWYNFGEIGQHLPGWRTMGVTIDDTNATALPTGWGGTGDEDPVTFEPRLPPDRTFASVLESVDYIRFTTAVPGFFYAFHSYTLQVDNPTIATVPEPTAMLSIASICGLTLLRRRR
jgi:hypothetical protein